MNRLSRIRVAMVILMAGVCSTAANCKPSTITVTSPIGGTLDGGAQIPVSWTTQNMLSDVRIDLTVDDGATFTNLIPAARFNAGTEQVTLPNPTDDVAGKAFIRLTNLDKPSMHADSAKFTIAAMTERYITFAEVQAIRPNAFPNNQQSEPHDCAYLGQVDGTGPAERYAALPRGVLYRIKCTGLTGGRADPESFKDFVLSNGWVVSRVDTHLGENSGGARIECTLPTVGSTTPATRCHMVTNRGGTREFVVAPLIRGRKNTSPF